MTENKNKNGDQRVQVKSLSLGSAQKRDPQAALAEVLITEAMLDARQAAIGQVRKYAGPTSGAKSKTLADDSYFSDVKESTCADSD
jgi:hypothetical protein